MYSLVFLPLPVSSLPPGYHWRGFTIALSPCRGLRGAITAFRTGCVFSSTKTVTHISFYYSLSQRQLGGCITHQARTVALAAGGESESESAQGMEKLQGWGVGVVCQ